MSRAASCYSSARASNGRVWHAARHAERLARDAGVLGLGDVDERAVLALLRELARPTLDGPALKLRVEAQPDARLGIRLLGTTTSIGDEPSTWRCVAASIQHPGASPGSSAKRSDRSLYDAAFAAAREAGVDEALLFDAADCLVEGTRTNVIVVRRDGAVVTPPLTSGAQRGIARGLLLERVSSLHEEMVRRAELDTAQELLAINAVRGVCPVIGFDGRPVGHGKPGPWAERFAAALRDD